MKTLSLHSWLNYSWWMWQGSVVKDASSHAVGGPAMEQVHWKG